MRTRKPQFRAYYDDSGQVLFFTGSGFPDTGNYILISKEIYSKYSDWRFLKVRDGKLVEELPKSGFTFKLQKNQKGPWKVVKNNAGLLLEKDEKYQEIDYYDTRTN